MNEDTTRLKGAFCIYHSSLTKRIIHHFSLKNKLYKRFCMLKLRMRNPYFLCQISVVSLNCVLLLISKFLNDTSSSLLEWEFCVLCSEIATILTFLGIVTSVIFKFTKKMNWKEFSIFVTFHIISIFIVFLLIMERI